MTMIIIFMIIFNQMFIFYSASVLVFFSLTYSIVLLQYTLIFLEVSSLSAVAAYILLYMVLMQALTSSLFNYF